MRRKVLFKSVFMPTEESYRDFNQTWRYKLRILYYVTIIIFSIFVLLGVISRNYNFAFQIGCYDLVLMIVVLFTDHNIGNYKRLKVQSNNNVAPYETSFYEDNMIVQIGKNKQDYDYDLVKNIIDGDNLMILKLQYRLGIIVDKNSMDKKEVNKLKDFLLEKCNITSIPRVPSNIHILKLVAWICSFLGFCVSLVLFITK